MFCQAGFDQWLTTIMQHLSHLSKPQATVLALWSFGMVLARSCALTAVSQLLAAGCGARSRPCASSCASGITTSRANGARKRQALPCGDLFCPAAGVGGELVAGHATGAGHRRDDVGGTVCGAGGQRGLSRLRHPGRVGRSCPRAPNMPGGGNGCGCCGGCAGRSPAAGR